MLLLEDETVGESPSITSEASILPDAELLLTRQVMLGIAEGLIELLRSPVMPRPFEVQLYELLEAVVQDASDEGMLSSDCSQIRVFADLDEQIFALSEEQDASGAFQNMPKLAELIDRLGDVLTMVRGSTRRVLIDSAQEILVELDNARMEVESSELVLAIAQLYSKATLRFGSRHGAEKWLVTPHDAIGGASPIALLNDLHGSYAVDDLLAAENG